MNNPSNRRTFFGALMAVAVFSVAPEVEAKGRSRSGSRSTGYSGGGGARGGCGSRGGAGYRKANGKCAGRNE